MRILLVSDGFPPAYGGLEAHVQRLGRGLEARGHDVTVIAGDAVARQTPGSSLYLIRPTASSYLPSSRRVLVPPWPDRAMVAAATAAVRTSGCEVIHSHGWSSYSAARAAELTGIPHLVTMHDYGFFCPCRTNFCGTDHCGSVAGVCCVPCHRSNQSLIQRTALGVAIRAQQKVLRRRTARFLAVSTAVQKEYCRRGFTDVERVPNFVDLSEPPTTLIADPPVVGFVGTDDPHKGLHVLKEAFRHARRTIPNLKLQIAGVSGSSQDGIEYKGLLSSPELVSFYGEATLIVVPSVWPDPCPTVAIEAMAAGRPVIASDTGGLSDIVQPGTGWLVAPNDVERLASAIVAACGRADLSDIGRAAAEQVVKEYSSHSVLPIIEAHYCAVK